MARVMDHAFGDRQKQGRNASEAVDSLLAFTFTDRLRTYLHSWRSQVQEAARLFLQKLFPARQFSSAHLHFEPVVIFAVVIDSSVICPATMS